MISRSRRIVFAAITGFIVSFCLVAGYQLDNFDSLGKFESGKETEKSQKVYIIKLSEVTICAEAEF
ncbi:MAG: hypothetical protein LUI10_08310 [Lachnospiraceae bacterium]|nr:hypothetical protein [Lachnospiraceae bacterium]